MSQQQHTQEPVAVLDEAMQQASHNGFMSLWQSYCDQKETISEMRDRIAELEKQRNELLEALEFAREKISELHIEAGEGDCHDPLIDDAIDSVKGGV